jgi:dihydrofolate reductase
MAKRKVILYSAVSLDGFIAREDDDQDYKDFYQQIDVTLMGRKTYEQVLDFPGEFPYSKTINYVFTR